MPDLPTSTLPPLASRLLVQDARALRDAMRDQADEREEAAPLWRITRDAYEGTGGFACSVRAASTTDAVPGNADYASARHRDTYLTRFSRESPAHFAARADRSAYTNLIAPIIDTYDGHLSRRRPQRASTADLINTWWSDVDGRGNDVTEWIAAARQRAQLFGWCAVLVDRPAEVDPTRPVTLARVLEPEEILDWQMGQDNALDWVRLGSAWEECDPATDEEVYVEVYTTWTRTEWAQVRLTKPDDAPDDQWSIAAVTGGLHDLGRVPVEVLRWRPSVQPRQLYGVSQIASVLPLALGLFNVESEYTDHLANQNFAFLAVQSDSPDALANLRLGTNEGMTYPTNAVAPSYIAPPSDVAMQYALRAEQLRTAIYAAAKLERPSADASGGDAASGVAKAYDFAATDAALQAFARELTRFEYALVDLVARWSGDFVGASAKATTIEYPKRYDARGIAEDLGALFTVLDEKVRPLMPPRAIALAVQGVTATVFPEASPADEATMRAETEAIYSHAVEAARTTHAAAAVDNAISNLPPGDGAMTATAATPPANA